MVLTAVLTLLALAAPQDESLNIAKGLPATFDPAPNYNGCMDPNASEQLTDGQIAPKRLWSGPGCVGWQYVPSVDITFDLGKLVPIASVEFHSGALPGRIEWPRVLLVKGSEDGTTWKTLGDLDPGSGDPVDVYVAKWLKLNLGAKKMRYVRFHAIGFGLQRYVLVDEIRILRSPGDSGDSIAPLPNDAGESIAPFLTTRGVRRRVFRQMQAVSSNGVGAMTPSIPDSSIAGVLGASKEDSQAADLRAKKFQQQGLQGVVVWQTHRFAYLQPDDAPNGGGKPSLSITALRGEMRNDALVLTNSTGQNQSAQIKVSGLPSGSALRIAASPWIDTQPGVLASSALPWAALTGGVAAVDLPVGTTTRLWFNLNTKGVAPGSYSAKVALSAAGRTTTVPFRIVVSKVAARKPQLSLTMFDYAAGKGSFDAKPEEFGSILALEREANIDGVWASREVLPLPGPESFNAKDELVKVPSFEKMDSWIAQTADFRHHTVNFSAPTQFAGRAMGTAQFVARVGAWAKVVQDHMNGLGASLTLSLVDEPTSASMAGRQNAWLKAIKATAPAIQVIANPQWAEPNNPDAVQVMDGADTVMVHVRRTVDQGGLESYRRALTASQTLWTYDTRAGGKALDPTAYYRFAAWRAFSEGVAGTAMWSMSDNGRASSSWNEYSATQPNYSPIYLGRGVLDSVHWQALTEGMEDSELFRQLREATRSGELKSQADQLLAEVEALGKVPQGRYDWPKAQDPAAADALRLRAIALLEKAAT